MLAHTRKLFVLIPLKAANLTKIRSLRHHYTLKQAGQLPEILIKKWTFFEADPHFAGLYTLFATFAGSATQQVAKWQHALSETINAQEVVFFSFFDTFLLFFVGLGSSPFGFRAAFFTLCRPKIL